MGIMRRPPGQSRLGRTGATLTDPALPADDEAVNWQAVAQIRREQPRWVTIWLASIGSYRARPCSARHPEPVSHSHP